MYAIIETGGKQYRVSEGTVCDVEKLDTGIGEEVVFDKVLLINNEERTEVGKPYLTGRKVSAKVLAHDKGKKIIVFKFKPKKNYRRKKGHRQPFTRIIIEKIS
ncbi:MAG TPA: 50S ribosomal protein L21 [Firmicutes bacterium]|jgi:large subunit ribosomal protein L21|nr:50S ribosomal protein L21 [Bacillota bacterium]